MSSFFYRFLLLCCLLGGANTLSAQYTVRGGEGTPLAVEQSTADKAERITVYVVNGTKDLSISYTSASTGTHQWYRYKTKRLEAEAVPSTQSGQTSTVVNIEPEYGYFVEEGAVSNYVWIVDYSRYGLNISGLGVSGTSDPCSGLLLTGSGTITPIYYYWPNTGTRRELKRQYEISYQTMVYDAEEKRFDEQTETVTMEGNLFEQSIPAPLCVRASFWPRGHMVCR